VLVVDDCIDMTQSLSLLLQMWGHEAWIAYDGDKALQIIHSGLPDVVLLDIGLPRTDGWAVGRRLRQLPGSQGVLVVAMSGYGRQQDRRWSRVEGCDFHLTKPFDVHLLESLLKMYQGSTDSLSPEDLSRQLTSLAAAAEVVEAIDDASLQLRRGWNLVRWHYQAIPWGVRFFHVDADGQEDGEVTHVLQGLANGHSLRSVSPG